MASSRSLRICALNLLGTEPLPIIGLVLTGRIPVQRNEGMVENLRITKAEMSDRPALADTGLRGEVQLVQTTCWRSNSTPGGSPVLAVSEEASYSTPHVKTAALGTVCQRLQCSSCKCSSYTASFKCVLFLWCRDEQTPGSAAEREPCTSIFMSTPSCAAVSPSRKSRWQDYMCAMSPLPPCTSHLASRVNFP